ncbi:hypothetical protein U1872_03385 [Sphingomonas sp. RB3P16]|uniref:hypothetical protein n=1 Tax=Parasphingomonas frigoris TaxID=3096163 RepID=UPI002FC8EF6D
MTSRQPVPRAARRWIIVGLVVLGGLLLFCAGIVLGRHQAATLQPPTQRRSTAATSPKARFRNVFSTSITSDPHVLDEQRKVVEMLESACKQHRQNCDTARNARFYLDAHQ